MKRIEIKLVGLLFVVGIVAGCSSARVHTTLAISGESVPHMEGTGYRISEVQFLTPTNVTGAGKSDFGEFDIKPADLQSKLIAAATAAYPKIFTTNTAAMPLAVCITRVAHADVMGADMCLSCVTLSILPMRTGNKTTYTVQARLEGEQKPLSLVEFAREDISWLSCFPTGWIPVPGGKGQRVMGINEETQLTQKLMLNSCVEAIAVALRRSATAK